MATITNKFDPNKKPEDKEQPYTPTGPAYVGMGQGTTPTQGSANASRFTGIQQFLGANKGAASQLGGAIQGGVQKQIGTQKIGAEREVGDVGTQKTNLQGLVSQGQQFQTQLGGETARQQLAKNQEQLKQFTALRTGQTQQKAADALAQEKQQAQGAVQNLASTADTRLQQLGSAAGRGNLLQEFAGAGRKDYGTRAFGKLDQALLQKDKSGALGAAKTNVGNVRTQDVGALEGKLQQDLSQAEALRDQSINLGKALQTEAQKAEQDYIDTMKRKVDPARQARQKEQAEFDEAMDIITGKKSDNPNNIDINKYMNMLGVKEGQQVFGVFNDPDFRKEAYRQMGRDIQGYEDLASEQDVDMYKNLAALSKSQLQDGNLVGPAQDQLLLRQAANLDPAVAAIVGQGGKTKIQERLDSAAENFLKKAMETTAAGYGKDTYDEGFGRSGVKESVAQVNLGEYLKRAGFNPSMFVTPDKGVVQSGLEGIGQTMNLSAFSPAMIANVLSGGQASGAADAAQRNAQAALQQNINAMLKQMGYGQVLTKKGLKDVFDQQLAVDKAMGEQRAYDAANDFHSGVFDSRVQRGIYNIPELQQQQPVAAPGSSLGKGFSGIGIPVANRTFAPISEQVFKQNIDFDKGDVAGQLGIAENDPDKAAKIAYAKAANKYKQDELARQSRIKSNIQKAQDELNRILRGE